MICPVCHIEIAFDTKRGKQKYCSTKCARAGKVADSKIETPIDRAIKAGVPVPQIARDFAIHASGIYARARRMGLSPAAVVHVPEWYEDALKLHGKGQTIKEISTRISINPWSIRRLLTMRGLVPNGLRAKTERVAVARVDSPRRQVLPRWYGETVIFDGPIVETTYRVWSHAKTEKTKTGQRVVGGKLALETLDSYQAFRACSAGGKDFVKADLAGNVLAYGTGRKIADV